MQDNEIYHTTTLTGRVHNLGYTFFPAAFTQKKSSRRCVGQDMATYWFSAVGTSEEGIGSRITLYLVGLLANR